MTLLVRIERPVFFIYYIMSDLSMIDVEYGIVFKTSKTDNADLMLSILTSMGGINSGEVGGGGPGYYFITRHSKRIDYIISPTYLDEDVYII